MLAVDAQAERAVKPFVIGRKAWLFGDTSKGAAASAQIYSLVKIAKVNGKESYTWLRYVLERYCTPRRSRLRSVAVVELLARDATLNTKRFWRKVYFMDRLRRWIQADHAIPTSTRASDQGILAERNSRSLTLAKIGTGTKMLKINTA
jgi:hypothetical protein